MKTKNIEGAADRPDGGVGQAFRAGLYEGFGQEGEVGVEFVGGAVVEVAGLAHGGLVAHAGAGFDGKLGLEHEDVLTPGFVGILAGNGFADFGVFRPKARQGIAEDAGGFLKIAGKRELGGQGFEPLVHDDEGVEAQFF